MSWTYWSFVHIFWINVYSVPWSIPQFGICCCGVWVFVIHYMVCVYLITGSLYLSTTFILYFLPPVLCPWEPQTWFFFLSLIFFFFWISQINMVIPKDRFGEDRDVGGQAVCQANSTDIVLQLAFMHLFPYKSASLLDHERPRGQVHLIHTWLMHRRAWETGQMRKKERRRHTHK